MSFDDLREQLAGVDRRRVQLIAERQQLVTEIGKHTRGAGAATRVVPRRGAGATLVLADLGDELLPLGNQLHQTAVYTGQLLAQVV